MVPLPHRRGLAERLRADPSSVCRPRRKERAMTMSREHQELLAQYDAVAKLHDILSAQLIAERKACDWSPVRKLASECDRIAELIEAKGWSL